MDYLKYHLKLFGIALFIVIGVIWPMADAVSETYWLPSTEKYYKYDTTPTRTTKVYKYVSTLDIETVQPAWVKLAGIYAKYTTINGGLKYVQEVIVTQPVPIEPVCAAVKCLDDFGVTYDINKLKEVLACPKVTIYKGQWVEYDGIKVTGRCN